MQPKKFSPIKKIKQNPKKKSPINKSLDKYREFISEKKDIPKSKNKKVIQVKRKRLSPKVNISVSFFVYFASITIVVPSFIRAGN